MNTHNISLNLNSSQLASLQDALKDSLTSVTDALESPIFDFERPQLENQADVLDILIDAIEISVTGGSYA